MIGARMRNTASSLVVRRRGGSVGRCWGVMENKLLAIFYAKKYISSPLAAPAKKFQYKKRVVATFLPVALQQSKKWRTPEFATEYLFTLWTRSETTGWTVSTSSTAVAFAIVLARTARRLVVVILF